AGDDTAAVWVSPGDGAQRWMDARGVEGTFPLSRRTWEPDRRRREDRADRVARDSACLEGRLDLAPSGREAAGHGARQGRAAAVPLPDFRAQQEQAKFDKLVRF